MLRRLITSARLPTAPLRVNVVARRNLMVARPLRFAEAGEASATELKTKINFRFSTPTSILYADAKSASPAKHANNQVDMVLLPGSDGVFGVLPNHTPTIAQLNPGLVMIQESPDTPMVKYFISGGFAFVKSDSTVAITAVEAVPLEELDPTAVNEGLEKYRAEMERETDPVAKAKAQIAFEVHTAMSSSLAEVTKSH